ncbi:MAG: DUF1772 domain-containing protein [Alphaproteobacteria bacterium]|nr:DUF1772 domain-containing protein [Alphaproteobacteria bacterium]
MTTVAVHDQTVPGINWNNLWIVALAVGVMVAAIYSHNAWYINFIHVAFGLMWTGIDLFMGFVIGPIMRSLPPDARKSMTLRLMPRMLFLMPTLSIITTTAGWFLAIELGYINPDAPETWSWWIIAALAIVTILTVQGLGILLPTNIRVYLEIRSANPDLAKVGRLMRRYIVTVAVQGCMQIAIIVVMTRLATGDI